MPSSRAKPFWCKLSDVLPQQPDFEDAAHFGRACVWLSSKLDTLSVSPNAGCKCQLGLGQAECLSGVAHHVAQVFWRFDRCRHANFLFGKFHAVATAIVAWFAPLPNQRMLHFDIRTDFRHNLFCTNLIRH